MTSLCRKISVYFGRMASIHGKLFLFIILIFTTAFIIYLFCAKATLRDSQKDIKESYAEHIRKADSLYIDLANYNKAMTDNILTLNSDLLADSLIKNTLAGNSKLSRKQYNALLSLIIEHRTAIEQCQEQYELKIQRDSLRLGVERDLLNGQTKTMVDLHLNKIEHEYNNITMWAAILTILFLVFSFYSIFKMDELIQQGNEGVKDIRHLNNIGEQEVTKLKTTTQELIDITKKEIDSLVQTQQQQMVDIFEAMRQKKDEMFSLHNDAIQDLHKSKNAFDGEVEKIVSDYESKLKDLLNDKSSAFKSINELIKDSVIRFLNDYEASNPSKE